MKISLEAAMLSKPSGYGNTLLSTKIIEAI